jgi:nitrate/nitrite transporter NarK
VNQEELEILAQSGFSGKRKEPLKVPWALILRSRNLWALSAMYFCYGWVLWMYLAWLPTYLVEERGFVDLRMGFAASLPLLAATITNALGGWISDKLAHQLSDLKRGRLLVSTVGFAIAGVGLIPGALSPGAMAAVGFLTFAMAGLELTVAVSWAICLDIGGEFSGSVSAVMNTCGNMGGAISGVVVGYLAQTFNWSVPLLASAAMCLAAALIATRIDPNRSAVSA